MARLTENEKTELLRLARSLPLPRQRPPIVPMSEYLLLVSELAKLAHPPKPVGFTGSHWKL
ncbi:MAG: hypothetical protein JHC76_12670 [Akkermansiaceae bacterium]|jgi:hypothetical protein|nr:hypothetical protein [Akkermansiaceae bacterium]